MIPQWIKHLSQQTEKKRHRISEEKLAMDPALWAATRLDFPKKMFDTL